MTARPKLSAAQWRALEAARDPHGGFGGGDWYHVSGRATRQIRSLHTLHLVEVYASGECGRLYRPTGAGRALLSETEDDR